MPRVSPTGLWRIYFSVSVLVIAAAWTIALVDMPAAPVGSASAQDRPAAHYLPATLLTLLLGATMPLVRGASLRLQSSYRVVGREIRRSRKVLESMNEGVLLLDTRGRVRFANIAARRWLPEARGHRFSSAIARAGFTLTHEDGSPLADADPIRSFCLTRGSDLEGVWLTRTEGHDDAWLAVSIRVLRDEYDAVSGATLTITDRSEEHERLNESAMSASILENMHDAVMITDAQGMIVRINPAFTNLTGYAPEELVGQLADRLRSDKNDADYPADFWHQLAQHGRWSGRQWSRRKSGDDYCAWQTATAIRDTRGQTVRCIFVSRDITDQEMRENELWQRANFDPLTGLANRTRFADRLEQVLRHAHRHEHSFALCYLDLDHFKPVNDTFGHAAGDTLLRLVALRIGTVLREEDLLARIGGDEFALLLPQTQTRGDSTRVAEKIVDALGTPFALTEGLVRIGTSIGIAQYPDDGETAAALTASADRALYRAKADGRNRWWHSAATKPLPMETRP
jgi:diguanylate cyclase (GGDEF)-like protein/PAS domain S-box-containing protein